jgi:Rv2525c-like, glycoside hydrolase-like domain
MTLEGVDFAWGGPVPASALRKAGKSFAIGYLSYDESKNLTRSTVDLYHRNGIGVVAIWETTAQRCFSGSAGGVADAREAALQASRLGMPNGRPIIFGPADFDAPESAQGAINDYFRGVGKVLGLARTWGYLGYWPGKRALDAGAISGLWQTYAWSGGNLDHRAVLYQYRNEVRIGGVDCDLDRALKPDYGQWFLPPAPKPADPYAIFPTGKLPGINVDERDTVLHVDGALKHPRRYRSFLRGTLRPRLKLCRDRCWTIAKNRPPDYKRPRVHPAWADSRHLGQRWQELNRRIQAIDRLP